MNTNFKKYIPFIPLLVWVLYVALNFGKDISTANRRLEATNLSREYTVGGLPSFFSITAYSSLIDDVVFLIVAILIFKFLGTRFKN